MPSVDMIGIVASNLQDSIRFYRMLGVDFPEPEAGSPYVEAKLPSGLRVSLNEQEMMKSVLPHWEEPKGHRIGLAFLCSGPEDVDKVHSQIVAAGFESAKEPWDAVWGQRYALLYDPDRNIVDLFAPLTD